MPSTVMSSWLARLPAKRRVEEPAPACNTPGVSARNELSDRVFSGSDFIALSRGSGFCSSDGASFSPDANFDGCAQLVFDSTAAWCAPWDSAVIGVYRIASGSRMLLANGLPAHADRLAIDASGLWVGTSAGLYRSTDAGASFGAAMPAAAPIRALTLAGANVVAATDAECFSSADGVDWQPLGLAGVTLLVFDAAHGLYAQSDHLRLSSDGGATWSVADSGLAGARVTALAFGGQIYAGSDGAGVFRQ